MATLSILTFLSTWNLYLEPLIFTSGKPDLLTLLVALNQFTNFDGTPQYALQMSATTLSIIPVSVVFLMAQRHVVEGIARSGRGATPDRLALTHGHGDHILGSGAFRGAAVFAHAAAPATIEKHLMTWAERYFDGSRADAESAITYPNVLFETDVRLNLGDKTARLFPSPGHSPDSICVLLEQDRVLCGGDTVVTGIVPSIVDGNSCVLTATLECLLELDVEVLVPGHGPILRGRGAIHEHLNWPIHYMRSIRHFVKEALAAGECPDDVPEAADYRRFVGDRLPEDQHGMLRRHRLVVDGVVSEVMAGQKAA